MAGPSPVASVADLDSPEGLLLSTHGCRSLVNVKSGDGNLANFAGNSLDQARLRETAEALGDRVERHVTVLAQFFAAQDQDAAADLHQRAIPKMSCRAQAQLRSLTLSGILEIPGAAAWSTG
uniref:hypothetical protein n=1 Tax=Streptomyces scabiei TaxID=1930 RepID=UPI0019696A05